jgi:hypothetical protein
LQDKKGKDIYEGDIVINSTVTYNKKELKDNIIKDIRFDIWFKDMENEIEVIGNIYENPELLEGKS